jgi:hypothetical protein
MRRHIGDIGIALLLVISTALVFGRVLGHQFVAWDDDTLLCANPHLTGLNAATVRWAFTGFDYVVRYQPLTWLSWAAIYEVSGRNPFGYHLASLVAHGLNAVLVFLLVGRLMQAALGQGSPVSQAWLRLVAGAAAALWAVHPLRVELVAWASAFLHEQALLFLLVSVLAYIGAAQAQAQRRRWLYWGAVCAYGLSLFSYPIGLGYVAGLVALDVYPLRRLGSRPGGWTDAPARWVWLEKVPFAVLAGLCLGITIWARLHVQGGWPQAPSLAEFSLAQRLMQACYVWAYYVWRPWVPFGLAPVYTSLLQVRPGDAVFVQSAVFLGLVTVLVVTYRRPWPAALPLWFSYLVLMVPMLGLTEHPHYANDRYASLAGVLWSIALAAAGLKWCAVGHRRTVALAAAAVVAVGLGVLSWRQTEVWRDSVTLFEHTLTCLGRHPYRFDLHWRLGRVLTKQGRLDEAIQHLETAVQIAPGFAEAQFALGVAFERKGQVPEAIQRYRLAVQFNPAYAEAYGRLGLLLAAQGQHTEAIQHLREAIRLDPSLAEARRRLTELEAGSRQ